MKRLGKMFLGAAMAAVMSLGTVAPALSAVSIIPPKLKVKVNGETLSFPDAEPYIDSNGRVQVPVRFVSEALGGKNTWDGKTQTVTITKDKRIAKLKIGSKVIDLNGVAIVMDTAAILKNDRTFVPVRYVSEAMGAKVEWLAEKSLVNITIEKTKSSGGVIDKDGYVFPEDTTVLSSVIKNDDFVEFLMLVNVTSNITLNLEGYKDVSNAIASKFGEDIAKQVYEYIKQKETEYSNLPYKAFYIKDTDQWLRVANSPSGDSGVHIDVMKKGVPELVQD